MENKAFDLIVGLVEQALAEQGFEQQNVSARQEDGKVALLTNDAMAYSILFNKEKERFELRSCGMTEEGPDNEWKSVSTWLFDPETDGERQAEGIAADFVDTIRGPKRKAMAQTAKKKSRKDEDGNVDPQFFMNRLVAVFPELREELIREKNSYGTLRGVTFSEEKVLPRMRELLSLAGEEEQKKRLLTVLSDMYNVGDMDVRSIITIVLLNGVEGERAEEAFGKYLSEDLKKARKAALRFKGKKVKPEKPKKKKRFMADTLDSQKVGLGSRR